MTHPTFATAFNCMDGRCQDRAIAFVRERTGAEHVDMINEPGIDGILSGHHSVLSPDRLPEAADFIKLKARISSEGHGSKQAFVFGHAFCAGNDVSLDEHREHAAAALRAIEQWDMFDRVTAVVFAEDFSLEQVQSSVRCALS